ncbi:MAG: hypothetical protein HUK06_08490 [Bacteroidaceae bacterium]|nr:hypothetical protein [Bacteroidaceae bacterium]
MKYTEESHITTLKEVEAFAKHLVHDLHVPIHPDDRFEDYVNLDNGERQFTQEEAAIGNRLMAECFDVCEKAGTDIYDLMFPIIEKGIMDGIDLNY